jgi:hypothetical protein
MMRKSSSFTCWRTHCILGLIAYNLAVGCRIGELELHVRNLSKDKPDEERTHGLGIPPLNTRTP